MQAKSSLSASRQSHYTPSSSGPLVRRCLKLLAQALPILLFWSPALPARGQLVLTLPADPIAIDKTTGGTAAFQAILTNNYAFDLFLNGDTFTVVSPASLDDTLFQNYFVTPSQGRQPTLAANGGSVTLDLFSVTLPANTPPGVYSGVLTLQGGATSLNAGDLATGEFAVSAVTAVPEAGSAAMLTSLLCVSGGILLLSRRRVAQKVCRQSRGLFHEALTHR